MTSACVCAKIAYGHNGELFEVPIVTDVRIMSDANPTNIGESCWVVIFEIRRESFAEAREDAITEMRDNHFHHWVYAFALRRSEEEGKPLSI